MKILVVVPDSSMGGITSSAVNFCNELTERGNQVFLLDMSGELLCAERLSPEIVCGSLDGRSRYWNLQGKDLKNAGGLKKIKLLLLGSLKKATIKSGLWFKLIFKKYRQFGEFDVAAAFRQCDPCYSFVLQKVSAKKKISFVHGELKYMGDISSWKKHMTLFDKVAYVSNAVREEFTAAYPELQKNACTIYNMFNKEQILKMAQEKNPFDFDKTVKNIVTVARIDNAFKRINLLPEICSILKEKTPKKFHWYVVGDGPDRDEVQQKIDELQVGDVLSLCGASSNPYAILKDADFSALISKSEAYPMTVIESLILKKAVLVTHFPSAKEMVEDGKLGLISDFSVEDIAEKALKMINDDSVLASCEAHLAQYEFSNDIAYQQFLESKED